MALSLIEQSRRQACAGGAPQPGQKPGQQMAKAKAGRQVADVLGGKKPGQKSGKGSTPAAQSTAPGAEGTQTDLSQAWPNMTYIILAVREGAAEDLKSWRLLEDRSGFEEI